MQPLRGIMLQKLEVIFCSVLAQKREGENNNRQVKYRSDDPIFTHNLLPFRSEHLYEPVEKRIVHDEKTTAPSSPPSPPSPRIAEEFVHREIQKAAASASSPPPKPPLPSKKAKKGGGEQRREKTPPKEPLELQAPSPLQDKSKTKTADEDAGSQRAGRGGKSIPRSKTASPTPAKEPVFLTQPEEPPSRTTTGMASRNGGR